MGELNSKIKRSRKLRIFNIRNFMTFLILSIALSGFIASIMQSSDQEEGNRLLNLYDDKIHEIDLARIWLQENWALDYKSESRSSDYNQEIIMLLVELNYLNDTLTEQDRDFYIWKISYLFIWLYWETSMPILHYVYSDIYGGFPGVQSAQGIWIGGEKERDGFDFNITQSEFEYIANSYSEVLTVYDNMTEFIDSSYNEGSHEWAITRLLENSGLTGDYPETRYLTSNPSAFYQYSYEKLQNQTVSAELLKDSAYTYLNKAGTFQIAITMTALTAILGTAMAARVTDFQMDQQFDEIKDELSSKGKKEKKRGTDYVSIVILTLSSILAIASLIYPLQI